MPNIFNIIGSGLNTTSQSLASTGNNIANAGVDGYSRQEHELSSRSAENAGTYYIGSGVQISDIQRVTDEYALLQLRDAISSNQSNKIIAEKALELDLYLGNDGSNVSGALDEFFASLQNLIDDPSSVLNRETVIAKSEVLSTSFHNLQNQITDQNKQLNNNIENKILEINTIAETIANLNEKIFTTGSPPDLLDERDRLLASLSEEIDISTIEQENGHLLIFIGNDGETLVNGATSHALSVVRNDYEPQKFDITIGSGSNITDQITEGYLGGAIDYRDNTLSTAQNRLGRLAIAFSEQINTQHGLGADLDGNLGGDFFRDVNNTTLLSQRASAHTDNAGTLSLSVAIDDETQLTDANYRLEWDGANYTLTNLDDDTTNTSATLPTTVDGITINALAGTPTAGDSFLIKPTASGAGDIQVALLNPRDIAAGQPIRTEGNTDNIGNVDISVGEVIDRTDFVATGQPDLPISVTFTAANTYELTDGGGVVIATGLTYNPAIENEIFPITTPPYDPGFRVTLTGDTPRTGDTFTIQTNTNGVQDNRNISALTDIQSAQIIEGERYNIKEAYGQISTFIGNEANNASVNFRADEILLEQAQDRISAISEVSLEEEAIELLELQQLFSALSSVLRSTSDLYSSFFNAI